MRFKRYYFVAVLTIVVNCSWINSCAAQSDTTFKMVCYNRNITLNIDLKHYSLKEINDTESILYAIEIKNDSGWMMFACDLANTGLGHNHINQYIILKKDSSKSLIDKSGIIRNSNRYWREVHDGGLIAIYEDVSQKDKPAMDAFIETMKNQYQTKIKKNKY
jgi:hypothetical protein